MGEIVLAARCAHVPEMGQREDRAAFLGMLPDHARFCCGEGSMHDTAMPHGAPGRDACQGRCDVVTPYFPSSGTGQTNVIFPVS